jgi:hypothetical protein
MYSIEVSYWYAMFFNMRFVLNSSPYTSPGSKGLYSP